VSADETWWEYRRISCLTLDTSNLKLPLKLALFCRGRFRGQFTITLSPPDTCGRSSLRRNWLCFARKVFGRVRTVKSGVQTFGFSCLTLDTSNLELLMKLALFFRGLWQAELVITLFSSRNYHSFESSRNWVCLAQKPCSRWRGQVSRSMGVSPMSTTGVPPVTWKLALFFQCLSRVPFVTTRYTHGTYPSFCPARNWVCLARNGGMIEHWNSGVSPAVGLRPCRGGPPWPPSGRAGTGACPYIPSNLKFLSYLAPMLPSRKTRSCGLIMPGVHRRRPHFYE
jgi:hypothetical protein